MLFNFYNKSFLFISLNNFLLFSFSVFFIGLVGILVLRHNLVMILMSVELLFLSISFNFVFFSLQFCDIFGQIGALFLLTIAAAESAIALSVIVAYYRIIYKSSSELVNLLD